MDTKGLQKEFISWCKSKNKSPKSEDETKQLFVAFMKEKHPEEYKQAVQNQLKQQQAQAKKAAHGTKLTYFKSLKNQCAEDEEVTYFKKGGSVKCGCKKKEDGGEISKAQKGTAVLKFKNDYNSRKVKDSEKDYLEGRGDHKVNNNLSAQQKFKNDYSSKRVKDSEEDYLKGTADHEINKKEYKPLKQLVPTKKQQTTGNVKREVNKYKKLDNRFPEKKACGSKLKKHLLGGSLNRIPFMLQGTPKGGIKKEYVLPEYMKRPITGAPTILPGRGYSGLEKPAMGLFNMFKTWVKGLPKTITLKDYLTGAAGVAGGITLGYDDTHNLYVRKGAEAIKKMTEYEPFAAEHVIDNLIKPKDTPKFPKFKK